MVTSSGGERRLRGGTQFGSPYDISHSKKSGGSVRRCKNSTERKQSSNAIHYRGRDGVEIATKRALQD